MPDRCCIPDCRAISGRQHGKISVFRIPKDESVRAKWLKAIGRKNFNPGPRDVLCEKHFQPECIIKKDESDSVKNWIGGANGSSTSSSVRARPILASGSLPTIFNRMEMVGKVPIELFNQRLRKNRKGRETTLGQQKKKNNMTIMMEKLQKKKKKRGRKKKKKDSMSLQQRLATAASTTIDASNFEEAEEEQKVQQQQREQLVVAAAPSPIPRTLKSQPLSPTKLKVTRQSSGASKKNREKIREDNNVKKLSLATSQQQAAPQEVCLRWNSHHANMQTAFPNLLNKEQYCDVTLVADGKSLKCHKLILSSCSSYFDQILEKVLPYQHPVIFMKDIPFEILKLLCDYMYVGEVNILQNDLDQLLAAAESLKIKGLAHGMTDDDSVCKETLSNSNKGYDVSENSRKSSSGNSWKRSRTETKSVMVDDNNEKKEKSSIDITDPLDLLEPTYEEDATPTIVSASSASSSGGAGVRKNDQHNKKTPLKRIKKRKYVDDDHESSPPVFSTRKGTRSRPNVKVPKYFNASFDNSSNLIASKTRDKNATTNFKKTTTSHNKSGEIIMMQQQEYCSETNNIIEETSTTTTTTTTTCRNHEASTSDAGVDAFLEFEIKTEPVDIEEDEQFQEEFQEETTFLASYHDDADATTTLPLSHQQQDDDDDVNMPPPELLIHEHGENIPAESTEENFEENAPPELDEQDGGDTMMTNVVRMVAGFEESSQETAAVLMETEGQTEFEKIEMINIRSSPIQQNEETTTTKVSEEKNAIALPNIFSNDHQQQDREMEEENTFDCSGDDSQKNNDTFCSSSTPSKFFEIEKVTSVAENDENTSSEIVFDTCVDSK